MFKPMWIVIAFVLTACGPSPDEIAEKKRIECLDKFCDGDVIPHTGIDEQVIKLNGQIFIAPKPYVMGLSGLDFYWPSKTPATGRSDRQPYPERGQNFYDTGIEIFLHSHTDKPGVSSLYQILLQAESEGRVVSKANLRPGLEVWHIKEEARKDHPQVWYVATDYREPGGDPPVLVCDSDKPQFDRCTTGFVWQQGISLDMRFRAKHGLDWPEIYQETIRILQLIRKG